MWLIRAAESGTRFPERAIIGRKDFSHRITLCQPFPSCQRESVVLFLRLVGVY